MGLPALAAALWGWSGRETLSKPQRPEVVDVVDIFGDVTPETRLTPGPVFGYYVGLDLVVGTAALSTAVGLVRLRLARRRRVREEGAEHAHQT